MKKSEKKPRGAAATKANKKKYDAEITKMEDKGEKFGVNQFNELNVAGFAKRCKFSPWVLTDGALKDDFARDVKRLGIQYNSPPLDDAAVMKLQKKAEEKAKFSSEYQKLLDLKIKEVERLEQLVNKHEKTIRELRHGRDEQKKCLANMLATGERFLL